LELVTELLNQDGTHESSLAKNNLTIVENSNNNSLINIRYFNLTLTTYYLIESSNN